ncbi:hypothetical protein HanXRQr2_Chr05g0202571 [Helianthus annuus]|uniref:Uncharacterized protein n=1 Tax=Helianthus annuus TaxID=4232 RepID=A0A251UP85_HELAN|nr:hypothetical protein HanXRQr2_Chr05g0202571 [Helianthus annuus]
MSLPSHFTIQITHTNVHLLNHLTAPPPDLHQLDTIFFSPLKHLILTSINPFQDHLWKV